MAQLHWARRVAPALSSSTCTGPSVVATGCSAARRPRCPSLARPHRAAPTAAAAAEGSNFPANGTGPAASASASSAPAPAAQVSSASSSTSRSTSGAAPQNGLSAAPPPQPDASATPASVEEDGEPASLLARVKRFFTGSKLDKARLAALGFGAFSAYGVISNINAGILITIAWLTVVRSTGLTPLDAGNWPRFLAIYAGLWIGSNFLRPLRLTLALAAAPLFDAAITAVAQRTRLPKGPAFVVMLLGIAVGTTSCLVATIAALGGFPPGCRLPWQPAA